MITLSVDPENTYLVVKWNDLWCVYSQKSLFDGSTTYECVCEELAIDDLTTRLLDIHLHEDSGRVTGSGEGFKYSLELRKSPRAAL